MVSVSFSVSVKERRSYHSALQSYLPIAKDVADVGFLFEKIDDIKSLRQFFTISKFLK